MRDRTEYYREWYLKNKQHKKEKTYAWLKKQRCKLGASGFREWKKIENAKYRLSKQT